MITIYQDNTSPSISDTITVNGVAFDLTGCTVSFRMRAVGSSTLKVDAAATVVSAADGTVQYDWSAGDTDTAGEYLGWWHVVLPSARTQDGTEFDIEVLAHDETAGYLCSLFDVRQELEIPDTTRDGDDNILDLIGDASKTIMDEYEREFAPAATSTRTFDFDSRYVSLAPYDLRAATTVRLHPESSSPTTLTEGTDFELLPYGSSTGTYTSLRLSNFLVVTSQTLFRFDHALVEINGDWGFASVPHNVKRACVVTVASWYRRNMQQYAGYDGGDPRDNTPVGPGTYSLPPAARRLLAGYRRNTGAF